MSRKRYTREFKQDAVRLVTEHGYTLAEAGRNLGINANLLGRWIREFETDESEVFRGNGKRTAEQEELRRLREKNPPTEAGARHSDKGGGLLREGSGLRHQFIDQAKKAYSVKRLCLVLGASRAGYYALSGGNRTVRIRRVRRNWRRFGDWRPKSV